MAAAVQSLVSQVESQFGAPPTLLVNCAGITRDGWLWKQVIPQTAAEIMIRSDTGCGVCNRQNETGIQ